MRTIVLGLWASSVIFACNPETSPPDTGTGGGSATGGAATGGTTGACPTALADRVRSTPIAVSPNVNLGSSRSGATLPVHLAVAPSGRAVAAWPDGTNVHVTPLDSADQRAGDDVLVPGTEVRGLVAHDDGEALLVVRGDSMVFVRLDVAGNTTATLSLVGGNSHTTSGDRWIDTWSHQGRLAWSGSQYAAYFGQSGNFGSQGNHQGDHYSMISPTGTLMSGGWDWGCSHSLDERLAHNGTVFAPICTSDTYPGAGIWFNNRTNISQEPSITNSGAGSKLGGLVPASDGFWFTFTTPAGRASFDVAFVHIGNNGTPSGKVYLTDTASVVEQYAYLAKYGDALLAGWATTAGQLTLATVDTAGTILEGPAAVTARIGALDDLVTYPNGDVGWAFAWSNLAQLQVMRVPRCP